MDASGRAHPEMAGVFLNEAEQIAGGRLKKLGRLLKRNKIPRLSARCAGQQMRFRALSYDLHAFEFDDDLSLTHG